MQLEFSGQFFSKNTQILNLMKIRPLGAKVLVGGRTNSQT